MEQSVEQRDEDEVEQPCPDYGPAGNACRNCRHWVGLVRFRWKGECHLRAPFHDGWPCTQDWDWCSDYEPLPAPPIIMPEPELPKGGDNVIDLKPRRPAA